MLRSLQPRFHADEGVYVATPFLSDRIPLFDFTT